MPDAAAGCVSRLKGAGAWAAGAAVQVVVGGDPRRAWRLAGYLPFLCYKVVTSPPLQTVEVPVVDLKKVFVDWAYCAESDYLLRIHFVHIPSRLQTRVYF